MNYKRCIINRPEIRLWNPFDIFVSINKNGLWIQYNKLTSKNDFQKTVFKQWSYSFIYAIL